MVKLVTVDANISAGKSTILAKLEENMRDERWFILSKEPIDVWEKTTDLKGVNILEHFYMDKSKYSFVFQINSLLTRLTGLTQLYRDAEAIEKEIGREIVIVSERSLYTDRNIFEEMLYLSNDINDIEHKVYEDFYNMYKDMFPSNDHIYIMADAKICLNRLEDRGRSGENLISLEYLEKLNKRHEEFYDKFLKGSNCLVINNNEKESEEHLMNMVGQIREFITAI